MDDVELSWPCQHFSIGNPRASGIDDVPLLLRRVADEIERREVRGREILDITFRQEVTADGPWWHATVYWQAASSSDSGHEHTSSDEAAGW